MLKAAIPATDAERRAAFDFWYNSNRGFSETARQAGRALSTIKRWARQDNWRERAKQIKSNISQGVDRKIEKREISNVRMAKACLAKEVKTYLDENHVPSGDLRAIVKLMQYIDTVEGNMPEGTGSTTDVVNIYIGQLIEQMSVTELQRLDEDLAGYFARRCTENRLSGR